MKSGDLPDWHPYNPLDTYRGKGAKGDEIRVGVSHRDHFEGTNLLRLEVMTGH